MEKTQISPKDFLDILFEGRNKDYGAYDLRKTYNRRLLIAISLIGMLCLIFSAGYLFAGKWKKNFHTLNPNDSALKLTEVILPEKIDPPVPIPKPQTVQMKTVTLTRPRIVSDIDVKPEDRMPDQEDIVDAKIGTINQNGAPDLGIITAPVSDQNGVTQAPIKSEINDLPFIGVQIESFYPDGLEAWRRFLIKNFHPSEEALDNGIQGTVIVEFIVDVSGNVSNVQAVSGPQEFREEAVRVIKKSGKWKPAIQNGREVKSYKKQPITVQLQSE